jgi:hypothetical protein
MPGIIPQVGDIVQIRVVCFTIDQVALNVTHWRVASTSGAGQSLQQIASKFDTDLATVYKGLMPPAASFRGVGATNISGVRTVEENSVAGAGIGTIAGTNLVPEQVSGLISWKTGSAGRHYRGRIYPGFLSAGYIDNAGRLTSSGRNQLDLIRLAYGLVKLVFTGADQCNLQLVLLHRPTPARPIPPNSQTTDVTSSTRSELLASQRRRGDYGPTNQPPF